MKGRVWLAACVGLGLGLELCGAVPWHHPLDLPGNGYWAKRVAVTLHNDSPEPLLGEPVELSLPALAGVEVRALRVCRLDGTELLYDLRDARGNAKRSGSLAADDRLSWTAECPPQSAAAILVYADNPEAWEVPDYAPPGFVNGGFEGGDDYPERWMPFLADDQHRLTWEKAGGRTGGRCAKAEVSPGAAPTWVQWQQSGIPVVPGRTYELRGWVRGEGVTGSAGWYVHVNGDRPQLINRTLDAGPGTYPWREVSTVFTAPTNAATATVGTLLHGAGQAWFDDASLRVTGSQPRVRLETGPAERMELRQGTRAKIKPAPDGMNGAEFIARNLGDQPVRTALVRLDLRAARARFPGVPPSPAARVWRGDGTETAAFRLGTDGDLLVAADLPPRSEEYFRLALLPGASVGPATARQDYERLLASPANLLADGSFEREGAAAGDLGKPPAGGPCGVSAGFSADACFGRRALELTIRTNAGAEWIGWHPAPVAVRPGATYLLAGWLRAAGLQGTASIHAHFHTAAGGLCASGAMVSTGPAVSGDSEWSNSSAFVAAPPDAATVQIHLTMNTQGTLRHDGVVLCELAPGLIDRFHSAAGDAPPSGQRLDVWEVNPLVKVFPDTPPQPRSRQVAVELARNEYEPFQLAVRGRFGAAVGAVTVSVSTLQGAAGKALPAVKVDRVGFVPVDHPSSYYTTEAPEACRKVPRGGGSTDGWAGWWPDPLAPGGRFAIPARQTTPLWFTVQAPPDAAPGDYQGRVALDTPGGPPVTLPLTVKVLPFTLPRRTRLRAIFDFRAGPYGWHGPVANRGEELAKWLRFMADHRLGVDGIEPPPAFAYQDGKVTMDAAGFDATARLCFDELGMNVSYTPGFFYMFGWAYPPKALFGLEPFTPRWNDAFRQAYGLFAEHVRQRGWHDRFVYYVSDEPHFQHEFVVGQMKRLCALIHEVDPGIPVYSSTWRHCPEWDDALDLWGVGQYGCFPPEAMERLQQAGKRLWFTCDGQMALDTPYLATERLLPYYCLKYGCEGFEFWGLSWWTYDPWRFGWHTFIRQSDEGRRHYWVRYPNGDGYLAYPGKAVGVDGPVSTIRLEQVREGLEDYEALTLLAEATEKARRSGRPVNAAEAALAAARALVTIPNAGGLRSMDILPDPDRLPAVRRAVNAALVDLVR